MLTIFGIFNELLSTQNVNVSRFARHVRLDFSMIFKHRVLMESRMMCEQEENSIIASLCKKLVNVSTVF